jgi:hypothetical protein
MTVTKTIGFIIVKLKVPFQPFLNFLHVLLNLFIKFVDIGEGWERTITQSTTTD